MEETVTNRFDDLAHARGDRVDGAERHVFTLDKASYAIDLGEESFAALEEALAPFIAVATRLGPDGRPARRPRKPTARNEGQLIRTWAQANGYGLAERGRIPGHVRDAYDNRPGVPEVE